MISIIVNIAANNAIGFNNELLYWLPNDLKRFRQLTAGHTIIMGRKTFDSLPKGALPNRRNIVLTRQEGLKLEGADCYHSLEEALKGCSPNEKIYIIGGAHVYEQAFSIADRLCITHVDNIPEKADTFFPEIKLDEWKEINKETHPSDEKHAYTYSFIDYERV